MASGLGGRDTAPHPVRQLLPAEAARHRSVMEEGVVHEQAIKDDGRKP